MTIGLCLIVTGRYDYFLSRLLESLDTHFFPKHEVIIYLFWDKKYYTLKLPKRFSVVCIPTEHKPFPFPTLYRYKYFTRAVDKIHSDYLFYMDVDMMLVGDVDERILPDGVSDGGIVATLHPGFYNGGGAWCDNHNSKAYTQENNRSRYFAGGFQGGETKAYLEACREMAEAIEADEKNGVMAEWHDESHLNSFLSTRNPKTLTPEYCMVQDEQCKKKYGLDGMPIRIIALEKNHEELRKDIKVEE